MAKSRAQSKHSRAARRATSPGIDTDKSLKDIKPPSRASFSATSQRPSVLAAQHSAGIQKKSKRGRKSQLSTKARKRQERGLEMAQAVVERTSKKLERSIGRGRNVKDRAKRWDDINKIAANMPGDEDEDDKAEEDGKAWETDDDDMDDVKTGDAVKMKDVAIVDAAPTEPDSNAGYLPVDEDGDEIL